MCIELKQVSPVSDILMYKVAFWILIVVCYGVKRDNKVCRWDARQSYSVSVDTALKTL